MNLTLISGLLAILIILMTELVLRQFSMSIPVGQEGSLLALLVFGSTFVTLHSIKYCLVDRKIEQDRAGERFARKLIGLDVRN